MSEIGCHPAAWIRGFFIILLALLVSACSDDEKNGATQQQIKTLQKTSSPDVIQRDIQQSQRPPFSQFIINKVSIDYPYAPTESFSRFIKTLRNYAKRQNSQAFQNTLSPQFSCQGLTCNEGSPIAEQFKTIVASLGKQPWEQLASIIETKYYQQINGSICGPANFIFNGSEQDRTASKRWGYVNGKNVRLRKQASTKAQIVTHISHNAVKQLSPIPPQNKGIQWVKVETLNGQKGFVAKKYFLALKSKQMCYQQTAGEWKISGFRDAVN